MIYEINKLLMNELIEQYKILHRQSVRAHAYQQLVPYPIFAFRDWAEHKRGVLPKCIPQVPGIVNKNARWLFGKPISLVGGADEVNDLLADAVYKLFNGELLRASRLMDLEGSFALRFGHYNDKPYFQVLSAVENIRAWYSQEYPDELEAVLIQYPIYDRTQGTWILHRESWTKTHRYVYKKIPIKFNNLIWGFPAETFSYGTVMYVKGEGCAVDETTQFDVESVSSNPYGFIPVVLVRHPESTSILGEGLLWSHYPIIDRINLTYHLMDKSNQLDSNPMKIYLDVTLPSDDEGDNSPGTVEALHTRESAINTAIKGDVKLLEPSGRIRPYMMEYTKSLLTGLEDAIGSITVSSESVANKGNLTQSVLNLLFLPVIQSTEAKRQVIDLKLNTFFNRCAEGLQRVGIVKNIKAESELSITWPAHFIKSEAEKASLVGRTVMMESSGLATMDDVLRIIADMEEVSDVDAYVDKLKDYKPKLDNPKPSSLTGPPEAANLVAKKEPENNDKNDR